MLMRKVSKSLYNQGSLTTSNRTLYMGMVMVDSFSIRRSPINENKLCGPKASDFLLKKTYYITLNILYSYRLLSHTTFIKSSNVCTGTHCEYYIKINQCTLILYLLNKKKNVDIQVLSY